MSDRSSLSGTGMFAERDAGRRRDQEAEQQLSFPRGFCTDDGRSIVRAGAQPIVKSDRHAPNSAAADFKLRQSIINFTGGKPGAVSVLF